MSSRIFSTDFKKTPELIPYVELLDTWIRNHPERSFFDRSTLLKDFGQKTDFLDLYRVIMRLQESGEIQAKYRVALPDSTFSEEEFDDIEKLPPTVMDSFLNPIEVQLGNVVPVYHYRAPQYAH